MNDADLRTLERRWRETGGVEDEASWLRARVQVGQLERVKLELAAFLGDAASQIACGAEARTHAPLQEGQTWEGRIVDFGLEATLRAALVYAEALRGVHWWKRDPAPWEGALRIAQDWLASLEDVSGDEVLVAAAALPVRLNCRSFSTLLMRDLLLAIGTSDPSVAASLLRGLDEAGLREQASAELIPWALGYHDSVRARVEGRSE